MPLCLWLWLKVLCQNSYLLCCDSIKSDMTDVRLQMPLLFCVAGVPRQHRGEIWKLLSEQYNLRQQVPSRSPSTDTPYKDLLKQLTSQQHAILIDLGKALDAHKLTHLQFV